MCVFRRIGRASSGLAIALVGLVVFTGSSRAGAIYSASLEMTLKYQGYYDVDGNLVAGVPDGVTLQGSLLPDPITATFTLGNGTADTSADGSILGADPLSLTTGDGIHIINSVSGTTTDPGDASFALSIYGGSIDITNNSASDVKLAFSMVYSSAVRAETSDPAVPAYGWTYGVFAALSDVPDFPDPEDPFDPSIYPLPFPDYLNVADTTFRPGSFLDSGTFALDVTVLAGGADGVGIGSFSHGDPFQPQAVAPEPATLAMAGTGLLIGLGALRGGRHMRRKTPCFSRCRTNR